MLLRQVRFVSSVTIIDKGKAWGDAHDTLSPAKEGHAPLRIELEPEIGTVFVIDSSEQRVISLVPWAQCRGATPMEAEEAEKLYGTSPPRLADVIDGVARAKLLAHRAELKAEADRKAKAAAELKAQADSDAARAAHQAKANANAAKK